MVLDINYPKRGIYLFVEALRSVAVSSDNTLLVYGTEEGSVGIFDIQKKEQFAFFKGTQRKDDSRKKEKRSEEENEIQSEKDQEKGKEAVTTVAITSDKKFIISGSKERIRITHIDTKTSYAFPNTNQGRTNFFKNFSIYYRLDSFSSIAVIPKSQDFILSSGDKSIKILHTRIPEPGVDELENPQVVYEFENAHRRNSDRFRNSSFGF